MNKFLQKPIKKQFRTVLFCLLAMGITLSCLGYVAIERPLTKNAAVYAQSAAQKFNLEMEYILKRVDALYSSLLFDPNIEQLMHTPYSEKTPAYLNSLNAQFSSYSLMNQDLAEIALAAPDMAWSNCYDAVTLRRLNKELEGTYGPVCLGFFESPLITRADRESLRLVFGHNVYGMYDKALYGQCLGSIVLSLDLSKSSVTLPAAGYPTASFLLVDQAGTAFLFNGTEEEYANICLQGMENGVWNEGFYETGDYLIYAAPLAETGIFIISAMDRHELNQEVIHATAILISVTLAVLLLIVLLMGLILRGMVQPLSQMAAYIDEIRGNTPGTPTRPLTLTGCEEIVQVSDSINTMMAEQTRLGCELQEATVNLYETQLGLKQAELEYLRSQINPHFLYNTLAAIQSLAAERGVPEIGDAAGALAKLLRHNIQGSPTVSLDRELEITQAYLTIQKLRFPGKLNVLFSIRENTRDISVIKLFLQPLVENAVYHGLEPKTGPGTLYIGARLEGDNLIVSVYDDGIGIPPAQLDLLSEALETTNRNCKNTSHIGLLNVQNRIRLHYGPFFGLTLQSTPGEGTRVTVKLPAHSATEEDH